MRKVNSRLDYATKLALVSSIAGRATADDEGRMFMKVTVDPRLKSYLELRDKALRCHDARAMYQLASLSVRYPAERLSLSPLGTAAVFNRGVLKK